MIETLVGDGVGGCFFVASALGVLHVIGAKVFPVIVYLLIISNGKGLKAWSFLVASICIFYAVGVSISLVVGGIGSSLWVTSFANAVLVANTFMEVKACLAFRLTPDKFRPPLKESMVQVAKEPAGHALRVVSSGGLGAISVTSALALVGPRPVPLSAWGTLIFFHVWAGAHTFWDPAMRHANGEQVGFGVMHFVFVAAFIAAAASEAAFV